MRFFLFFFFLFSSSFAHAAETNPDILKDEKASAWLKTQKWSQHIIDEWIRINDLPNSLTEGFDNSVCHAYAAENNLIAGLEGVGEFPENHKEIIPVEWEIFLENEHATGRIVKFDMYNNGQPLIIEKFIYKDGERTDKYRLYNKEGFSLEDYKSLRKNDFRKLKSYRRNFYDNFEICKEEYENICKSIRDGKHSRYNPFISPSKPNFFTYDGKPYVGVKYYEYTSNIKDIVYSCDNGVKKRVCVYEEYKTHSKKQTDDFKKRFSLANENMKRSIAENRAFYLKGLNSAKTKKRRCSDNKDIGKDFFDLVNSRLSPEDKCPEDLSKIVPKIPNLKQVIKNGVTTYLEDGKLWGTLQEDGTIIDTDNYIIGYKEDNKITLVGEQVSFTIEED